MKRTKIAGIGHYVPDQVITNHDLEKLMDTTDEWIQERTGIQERRFGIRHKETTTTMGAEAARKAIEDAGITKEEIDFIIFATLSPDYFFPDVEFWSNGSWGFPAPRSVLWIFAINVRALSMDCP